MSEPRGLASLVLVLSALTVSAQVPAPLPDQRAPQAPPLLRSGATLVPVDVTVVDPNGDPVTDLRESDFTVFEDGVRQEIRYFSARRLEPPDAARVTSAEASRSSAAHGSPAAGRVFLVLLGHGRLQVPKRGLDGVLDLVRNRLLPEDRVAVMAYNRATDFTTDRELIAGVIERFKRAHEEIEAKYAMRKAGLAGVYEGPGLPPDLQKLADQIFGGPRPATARTMMNTPVPDAARIAEMDRRTTDTLLGAPGDLVDPRLAANPGVTLDEFAATNAQTMSDLSGLYLGIEYLSRAEGEKHLIFVSQGGLRGIPRVEDEENLAHAASDARVTLSSIHTGGLEYGARGAIGATMESARTARMLASETGGTFYANRYSLSSEIDHLDRATRGGYQLAYQPTRTIIDGTYRSVEVKVNRPGLTVGYRRGYYARPPAPVLDRQVVLTQSRVSAAAVFDREVRDLAVSVVQTSIQGTEITVEFRVDTSRMVFDLADGRHKGSLDVVAVALDQRRKPLGHAWQRLVLDLPETSWQQAVHGGIPHRMRVTTTARPDTVKVIVYDYRADLVGSVFAAVQRPER